jgi:type IV pilus assembly protein PilM
MFKPTIITGLDIGNNTIKIIQMSNTPLGWHIVDAFREDIPLETQFKEEDKFSFTVEMLKKAVEQRPRIKNSYLVTAIGRNACILKYLTLPTRDEEEIARMLPFELEKYIPQSLGKVVQDYQVIDMDVDPGKEASEVMVVVAKRDIVDNHLRLLAAAGLKPELIDLSSLAMYNAFVSKHPEEQGVIAVLDVGTQTTEINILDYGLLKFTRSAPIGGSTLNQMLQKELGVDLQEIERLKVENQIFTKDKFREIGENWGRLLRNEINQSLEAFRTERQKKKIDKIYMSGGGSKLVGLADYLERKLGIPVLNFNPFPVNKDINENFQQEFGHLFPIALGLAYRGIQQARLQVNLLPEEMSRHKKKVKRKKLAVIIGSAALAAALLVSSQVYLNLADKKKQIAAITRELGSLKKEVDAARVLQSKIALVEEKSAGKELPLETLRYLSMVAPSNVYIDHLVVTREGQVSLRGKTESHGAAAGLAILLEKSGGFEKVINKGSREVKYGDTNLVEFEIDCLIKGAVGVPAE